MPRRVQAPGNVGAVHIPDTADRRWCAVRGWAAAWGRRPPHLIRLAFFHRHDGEQHLASLPPALPTKSRRTGERTGRPRDALAELPWDKLRLSAVLPRLLCGHRRRRRRRLAGQTQQCQPDASWRRWTSRPKACVDRLQRQQLGLKPRRLMRSAADLDAGVEVEPGQRRLTGGRRARFPASGLLNVPARPTHGRGTGRPIGGPGWSRRSIRAPAPVPSIPAAGAQRIRLSVTSGVTFFGSERTGARERAGDKRDSQPVTAQRRTASTPSTCS